MSVSIIPLHEVVSASGQPAANILPVDIFDDTVQYCTLDCRRWKSKNGRQKVPVRAAFRRNDVVASIARGCGSCKTVAAFLDCILMAFPDLDPECLTFRWTTYSFKIEVTDEKRNQRFELQFFLPLSLAPRVTKIPCSNFLAGDTSSSASLERARQWIQNCERSHPACGVGRNVPLPTRLVDTTPISNANGDPGVRLAMTKGQTGTYACLSHCWGDPKYIHSQTRRATEAGYLQFISWQTLPKNFQDGICIARVLGLRYIWIDSLCIIQDSTEDWRRESGRMADVYQNSYLTIASAWSPDSRGGCFSNTRPDQCFRIQGHLDLVIGMRHDEGSSPSGRNPLFTRAWVFQERKLSRRILYCSKGELEFACPEMNHCECGVKSITPHVKNPTQSMSMDMMPSMKLDDVNPQTNGLRQYWLWKDIVTAYSQLQLTYGRDKLSALSGCAKAMLNIMGPRVYLAGLWDDFLIAGLLWYIKSDRLPRPSPSRAPTWSWANVDAPKGVVFVRISHWRPPVALEKDITAVKVVPAGEEDPTGGVAPGGYIKLKAELAAVYARYTCFRCSSEQSKGRIYVEKEPLPRKGVNSHCTFSESGLKSPSLGFALQRDFVWPPTYMLRDHVEGIPPNDGDTRRCLLAPIFLLHVDINGLIDQSNRVQAFFLVLKMDILQKSVFERVAFLIASYKDQEEKESWFQDIWLKFKGLKEEITLI